MLRYTFTLYVTLYFHIVCYVILSHRNNIHVTVFECLVSFDLSMNWESWITVMYFKISVNG